MAAKRRATADATDRSGWRKVETGIAGFWQPDQEGDEIQGIVGERCEGKGHDGRPVIYYRLKLVDDACEQVRTNEGKKVMAKEGLVVGVGGAVLRNFLEEHKGAFVLLVYKGLGEKTKGKNAPRLYDAFVSETGEVG